MADIFPIDVLYEILDGRYGARLTITTGGVSGAVVSLADASLAPVEVELPASGEVIVKKTDSTENTVTVIPHTGSGHTVDGDTSLVFSAHKEAVRLVLVGTDWVKI